MNWYEKLYNDLGPRYLDYEFTKGTQQEIDFIEELLGYDKSLRILDVGCGAGRHLLKLVNRHYPAFGLDLSFRQLEVARDMAIQSGIKLNLIRSDARAIPFIACFDWAICLCEAAFGIMDSNADNEQIIRQVYLSLKPQGKFLLNVLHASFAFRHPHYDSYLDVKESTGHWTEIYTDEMNNEKKLECSNRYYTFPEIKLILEKYGFTIIDGWGCQAGNFRKKEPELDDFELLILSVK